MKIPVEQWMMEAPRPGLGGEAWHDLDERLLRWRREFEELVTSLTSTVTWSGQASDAFHQKAMNSESSFKTMRVQTGEIGDRMDTFFTTWRRLAPQIEDAKRALRIANEHVDRLNEAAVQDSSLGDQVVEAQDAAVRKEDELVSLVGQLINSDRSESAGVNGAAATLSACLDVDTRSAWVGQIVPPSALLALSLAKVHMPSDQDLVRIGAAGQLVGADTVDLRLRLAGIVAQHFPDGYSDGDTSFDSDIAAVINMLGGEPIFVGALLSQVHPLRLQEAAAFSAQDKKSDLFLGLHKTLSTASQIKSIDGNYVCDFLFVPMSRRDLRDGLQQFVAGAPKDSKFISIYGEKFIVGFYEGVAPNGDKQVDENWEVVNWFLAAMSPKQVLSVFAGGINETGKVEKAGDPNATELVDFYLGRNGLGVLDKKLLIEVLSKACAVHPGDTLEARIDKANLFGAMVVAYGRNGVPEVAKDDVLELLMRRSYDISSSVSSGDIDSIDEAPALDSVGFFPILEPLGKQVDDSGDSSRVVALVGQGSLRKVLLDVTDSPERLKKFSEDMRSDVLNRLGDQSDPATRKSNILVAAGSVGYAQSIVAQSRVDDLEAKHQAINRIVKPVTWILSPLSVAKVPINAPVMIVEDAIKDELKMQETQLDESNYFDEKVSLRSLRNMVVSSEIASDPTNPSYAEYLRISREYQVALDGEDSRQWELKSRLFREAENLVKTGALSEEYLGLHSSIDNAWTMGSGAGKSGERS